MNGSVDCELFAIGAFLALTSGLKHDIMKVEGVLCGDEQPEGGIR